MRGGNANRRWAATRRASTEQVEVPAEVDVPVQRGPQDRLLRCGPGAPDTLRAFVTRRRVHVGSPDR